MTQVRPHWEQEMCQLGQQHWQLGLGWWCWLRQELQLSGRGMLLGQRRGWEAAGWRWQR